MMKHHLKYFPILISFLFLLGIAGKSSAQEAYAELDTNKLLIGDQTNLQLNLIIPQGANYMWPQLQDTLITNLEVLSQGKIDSTFENGVLKLSQKLLITSFDSGFYAVPPLEFAWQAEGDTSLNFLQTNPFLLEVGTVAVDTTQAIKDIKHPMEAPYTLQEALPWILGGLGLVAVIFGVWYYLRKRKKGEKLFAAPPKPKLPPHIQAINELESLRLKKLWQAGQVKAYHTELTDIIREYVEGRFHIGAVEMTSDEIMDALKTQPVNDEAWQKLTASLSLADLVKFAKAQPLPLENDSSLNNCIDFVNETRPAAQPQESKEGEALQEMKNKNE